ncbi:MAG: MBL fold metallo-hydrolase [Chloroflexi bacterium]|nr:MBL fold metallo-hydrolase [Chloroflexota bacterium]
MEITWLGHSCFKISGSRVKIITDPFPPTLGYSLGSPTAQIVTISHPHPSHSYVEGVTGQFKKISGPGEYEIGDVLITGIASFHDAEQGKVKGRNTIYLIEIDDVVVCHLGDLGHGLSAAQVEEMGNVDVLLLPVGGGATINATTAAAVVRQLEPKAVVPMHYKTPVLTQELDPVDKFLNEIGVKQLSPQPKLMLTKSTIPLTMQVYLLGY